MRCRSSFADSLRKSVNHQARHRPNRGDFRMNVERLYQVILAPVVTEKATIVAENNQQVVFHVALDATKPEIKADRKSTRLNSSHVAISYAVFCLKKKKKQT